MARSHSRLTHRPNTRDADAAAALLDALPELPTGGPVLVVGDTDGEVEDAIQLRGHTISHWRRMAQGTREARAWPVVEEPCVAATLRLPKGKEALALALSGIAASLAPGAPLYVYGANDEGIKPVRKRLSPLFLEAETVDTRRHCRVIRGLRAEPLPASHGATLAHHERVERIQAGDTTVDYIVYPGVFAKGQLDEGSALLLDTLPALPEGAHVVDYASGAGILALVLSKRHPDASFQLLDADAVAVAAAKRNMPGALCLCGDSWSRLPAYRRYDRIVSNPPIHTGKGRDYSALTRLVEGAPARLLPGGTLWLVVQRQVPLKPMLEESFDDVSIAAESTRFRVWRCGRLSDRYGI